MALLRKVAHPDSRIEPIPVGVQRYEDENSSPLLTIPRREGQIVK